MNNPNCVIKKGWSKTSNLVLKGAADVLMCWCIDVLMCWGSGGVEGECLALQCWGIYLVNWNHTRETILKLVLHCVLNKLLKLISFYNGIIQAYVCIVGYRLWKCGRHKKICWHILVQSLYIKFRIVVHFKNWLHNLSFTMQRNSSWTYNPLQERYTYI